MNEFVSEFAAHFGSAPDVIASAPGRINVIGEHIDYSEGWVLPFALDYRTTVALRRREDSIIRLASLQRAGSVIEVSTENLTPDPERGWVEYVLGMFDALEIYKNTSDLRGFDILIDGQVPVGAGLSSSAALECATGTALNAIFELGLSATEIALKAQYAENTFVGMPCGIMDQAVSMLATANHALLLDCKTMETTHIPFDVASRGLALLVIDTQAHHSLVDGGYAARRESCERVSAVLGLPSLRTATFDQIEAHRDDLSAHEYFRARHAVTEIARVHAAVDALRRSDFHELGKLLNESHVSLRDDYTVSCPELDVAVDSALAVGAMGARMVGGGFGGSAIALAPVGLLHAIQSAVSDAFAASNFKAPRFFVATPQAGARVEQI